MMTNTKVTDDQAILYTYVARKAVYPRMSYGRVGVIIRSE